MKTTLAFLVSLLTIGFVFGETPGKGCGDNPADLVFVLDESGSIQPSDFKKQLDFTQSTIETLDVGFNRTHVGVLTFATNSDVIFPLGKYAEEAELKKAVKDITQKGGGTNTHLALKRLRKEMFSMQISRTWVRHVAIVITDGESNNPRETKLEAQHCHAENIQVLSIGVGKNVQKTELEAIASSPDLVFTVDSYAALQSLKESLARKACEPPTTPSLPTTTTTEPTPPPLMTLDGCAGHKFMDHIWSISDQAGVDETNLAIDFINSLTLDMTIDPEHIQVGLTPKCCDEARGILLKDHDTGKGFRHALAKRRLVGLRTDRSIDYIRRHGHSSSNGGRSEALKYGILIVDNRLENWEQTLAEAERAKAQDIRLIVIAVGDRIQPDKLRQLCSSQRDYLYVESYCKLADLKIQLIQTICEEITGKSGINTKQRDYFERFLY